MTHERTHASFFSGVGGLDLGLERVGWRTVSFSEIDPYASAVLAERWSGIPNQGCIKRAAWGWPQHEHGEVEGEGFGCGRTAEQRRELERLPRRADDLRSDGGIARAGCAVDGAEPATESWERGGDRVGASGAPVWQRATLWSGGFPCQDLSVAGKRRGMGTAEERTRSGLAHAFLDLADAFRPPAILLENVPGLLSSHRGRDLGALLHRLGELGYWWAYRILDAQFFGVPQRRRRVFICALHAGAGFGADSAGAVLSVGARCGGHPGASGQERPDAAGAPGRSVAGTLTGPSPHRGWPQLENATDGYLLPSDGAPSDADGVRAPHGMAGRLDDRPQLAPTLNAPSKQDGWRYDADQAESLQVVEAFVKRGRAQNEEDDESWGEGDVMPTLNAFDVGDVRTTAAIVGGEPHEDPLLPLGLDSHRYRCCGNGVVSDVTYWIGVRLARGFGVPA